MLLLLLLLHEYVYDLGVYPATVLGRLDAQRCIFFMHAWAHLIGRISPCVWSKYTFCIHAFLSHIHGTGLL